MGAGRVNIGLGGLALVLELVRREAEKRELAGLEPNEISIDDTVISHELERRDTPTISRASFARERDHDAGAIWTGKPRPRR